MAHSNDAGSGHGPADGKHSYLYLAVLLIASAVYLGCIVLLPLGALGLHASGLGLVKLWALLTTPRVMFCSGELLAAGRHGKLDMIDCNDRHRVSSPPR